MSNKISNVVIALLIILGIALLLYPSASNYLNSLNQSAAMASYINSVKNTSNEESLKIIEEAKKYNEQLAKDEANIIFRLPNDQYSKILSFKDTDIMSIISIPKIDLILPIYHGTNEASLQSGVGHLEGSSLPVGGMNTHTVLMGHRGLPSAKLFTNLGKIVEGDIIYIQTVNLKLAYKVDSIVTVEPKELAKLKIENGKDYLSLITCTPYGINTHRLIIGASRTEISEEEIDDFTIDDLGQASKEVENKNLSVLIIIIVLILLFVLFLILKNKKRAISLAKARKQRIALEKEEKFKKLNRKERLYTDEDDSEDSFDLPKLKK